MFGRGNEGAKTGWNLESVLPVNSPVTTGHVHVRDAVMLIRWTVVAAAAAGESLASSWCDTL